jgi:hypothetical protein
MVAGNLSDRLRSIRFEIDEGQDAEELLDSIMFFVKHMMEHNMLLPRDALNDIVSDTVHVPYSSLSLDQRRYLSFKLILFMTDTYLSMNPDLAITTLQHSTRDMVDLYDACM